MEYQRRTVDTELDFLMPEVSAIAIEGAKAVGKTLTAARRAATVFELNNPRVRSAVAADFDLVTQGATPILIDEWQLEPQTWDRVKVAASALNSAPGEYLLTGSAGAAVDQDLHSGAGRIVRLIMRPMSMAERLPESNKISLSSLLIGDASIQGTCALKPGDYLDEILSSGFPALRALSPAARDRQLDSYLARVVDRDLVEAGFRSRRPAAMTAWLKAYAAATATTADYKTILDAATPGEGDRPTSKTVAALRENLIRIFILEPLPAWQPVFSPLNVLAAAPKHHLVDPALAARLVGVSKAALATGQGAKWLPPAATWAGALFESLALQSLRVYAQPLQATVSHMRTQRGEHEIDIIVEDDDMGIVAIETKYSDTISDSDVKHLLWLKRQLGDRVKDMVVVNTGPYAYRRKDGVAVIPLALLGP